jgi:hypothetical protein
MKAKTTGGSLVLCFLLAAKLVTPLAGDADHRQTVETGSRGGYWYVSLGSFDGPEIESLEESSAAAGLGVGYGMFVRKNLAVEFESGLTSTDYDLPLELGRGSSETLTLDTWSVTVNVKTFRNVGRMQPFFGVGVGFGLTELAYYDDDYYDYYGYYYVSEPLEDETTFLAQFTLGADFRIKGRHHLGLSYRKLEVFDDFDWLGEEVDAGGDSLLLNYRFDF